ncbi:hypothetical protein SCHPADRAFT_430253 [Schizopora paradoxa]|uniref:DUF6534 domain-containing protein n=1 Tax=Schizopora paradoxa TaxID=27342 RepID=A0A0H2RJL1_9AGAM|nr:hypothetical protein SCHPADRAFT_430253 [Schizopora paradoxa]
MSGGYAATSGPLLLGYLFNWGLFGVLSVQVYLYYLAFPGDRRVTRWLVAGIYTLELTQTVLLTRDAFNTFAIHFGEESYFDKIQLIPLSVPIFSGLVSCAVQMHYGYLLRMLSGSRLLGVTVAILAIVQCSAALVQGIQAFITNDISELPSTAFSSETVWLSGSATCDLLIASAMTFILLKKDTRLPATHALITKLIRVIVETGSLTAISATIQMVLFISLPSKTYFCCVGIALAKLYSNSLLAVLNSRIHIEDRQSGSSAQVVAGSSIAFYVQDTNSRPTALPYSSAFQKTENNVASYVVNVNARRRKEVWDVADGMVSMPMDDAKSESSTATKDLDSVLTKA